MHPYVTYPDMILDGNGLLMNRCEVIIFFTTTPVLWPTLKICLIKKVGSSFPLTREGNATQY